MNQVVSKLTTDLNGGRMWIHVRSGGKLLGWTKPGSGISETSYLHYDAEGLAKGESTSLDAWVKILAPEIRLEFSPPPLHKFLVEPTIRNPYRLPVIGLLLLAAVACFIVFNGKFPFGDEAHVLDTPIHQTSASALKEVQAPPVTSLPEQPSPTPTPGMIIGLENREQPTPTPTPTLTRQYPSPLIAPSAPYPTVRNEPMTTNLPMRGERFPQTRLHILTRDELATFDSEEVRYAINELFARHGANFGKQEVLQVFEKFDWYRPRAGVDFNHIEQVDFTNIEKTNVKMLGAARDANPARDAKPSGKPEKNISRSGSLRERTKQFDDL